MVVKNVLRRNKAVIVTRAIKNVPFSGSEHEEEKDMMAGTLTKGTVLRYIGVAKCSPNLLLFSVAGCHVKKLEGLKCWLSRQEVANYTTQ